MLESCDQNVIIFKLLIIVRSHPPDLFPVNASAKNYIESGSQLQTLENTPANSNTYGFLIGRSECIDC